MQLEVRNLTRCFGSVRALDDVSFTVPSGEVFGFVGPNGAGKTTALRILSGLDTPDAGDAFYDGISIVQNPEKVRRKIGYMPDTLPNAGDINVGEFLDFYAAAFGLKGAAKKEAMEKVEHFTRLGSLRGKFLSQLSKGMKQRVNLARILIHDPEVLLLDEPAAGLDPRTRFELRESLKMLAQSGKTILISSHILTELESLISGVVILSKGKLIRSGAMSELQQIESSGDIETVQLELLPGTKLNSLPAQLQALPGVQTVRAEGGKKLVLVIKSSAIHELLLFMGQNKFPLAELRRPNQVAKLEEIFMKNTTGEGQ